MPRPKKTETATIQKSTKGTTENIVNKALASIYEKRMDMMERKFNLTSSELSIPDRMSSGMLMIDYILGGGYVTGTMVQVSGIEKGGKSTLCMTTLGSAINVKVPIIQYWDAENALNDPRYAEAIVRRDIGKLFYGPARAGRLYQESVLEDFYNGTKFIMRSLPDKLYRSDRKAWYFVFDSDKAGRANMEAFGFGKLAYDKDLFRDTNRLWCPTDMAGMQGMIFCDSYPALVTADEDESDEDKNAMALNARAFSKNIRKIVGIMKRKGFIVMGVNQIRQKPGFNMGNPEYEPGGEALKFYSSVRLQSRPRAVPSGWDQGVTDTGNKTSEFGQERSVVGRGKDKYAYIYIKNTKNKVGTPLLGTWMRIWYSDGNSRPHGYDPVFDTFTYLKMTGRIAGKRKDKRGFKILLDIPELKGKAFTWEEFKLLIVASEFPKMKIFVPAKKDKLEERIVSEYALSHFKFKGKIPDLRKALFKEVKSGECYNLVNNSSGTDDDDDDIEE